MSAPTAGSPAPQAAGGPDPSGTPDHRVAGSDLQGYPLEFDPQLVEEAVLRAVESAPPADRRSFREERNPLYELPEDETRERSFRRLHGRWFVRLGLADPVRRALADEPSLAAGTSRCLVLPVVKAAQEYADLQPDRRGDGPPTLLLALRVTTLLDPGRLLPFLRRELLHVADMLDPEFGFERELPPLDGSRALENLLRQRYRTLWDATVDGRLQARHHLEPGAAEARRREFHRTFPMLAATTDTWFDHFFDGPRPTHAELVAFATAPGRPSDSAPAGRCPLCRMPTPALHSDPGALARPTLTSIHRDFPAWCPDHGICLQCADLYRAAARTATER